MVWFVGQVVVINLPIFSPSCVGSYFVLHWTLYGVTPVIWSVTQSLKLHPIHWDQGTALHCTALHFAGPNCTALSCSAFPCTTALHWNVLFTRTTALRTYGQHAQILPQNHICLIKFLLFVYRNSQSTNVFFFVIKWCAVGSGINKREIFVLWWYKF